MINPAPIFIITIATANKTALAGINKAEKPKIDNPNTGTKQAIL